MVAGAETRSGQDAIISVVVGVAVLFDACWWDARLQARQDALTTKIAARQDDLARDLANQAELLENSRFVRQIATSMEATPEPFTGINLGATELAGLPLQCTDLRRHRGCADFSKADLGEANLARTDLDGAIIVQADLHQATLDQANFNGAILDHANLDGVATRRNRSAAIAEFFAGFVVKISASASPTSSRTCWFARIQPGLRSFS
jgi:uncharacterized protein YjbI with pentapeptide repeats